MFELWPIRLSPRFLLDSIRDVISIREVIEANITITLPFPSAGPPYRLPSTGGLCFSGQFYQFRAKTSDPP